MVEIEIGNNLGEPLGVGEPGARVFRRVARDGAGRAHGIAQRRGTEIRGAGGTAAAPEVHRDPEPAVARVLDGLDLAQAHADDEPLADADRGLGTARALLLRLGQGARYKLAQSWVVRRESRTRTEG